ncbi:GntR family transcriptional regulator [Pseudonocardia benzenivorans]|uniref:Transcriptional regulator, GntR family with UTRA sensor domain protein n=2 Tax=Pseudonocardia TaxID=1847 RepID=F4D229_PSEUX|nr:GntR family transcriptional regulator [Pseudonocardia dioxanivorans]AEA28089.1 transcriptional regulator, GntR family with UTRA sensor domain protein [Pseudonocardia dioxanivorans CB1190]
MTISSGPVPPTSSRERPRRQPRAERARHVADVLRHQITTGRFPDGMLPGETALCERLGASRNAVREALGLLRSEGLIARRQGVGTMIVMAKFGHGMDRLAGLAEALTGYGTVTNEVRAAHFVDHLPAVIAERLEVPRKAGAVYIERLRWSNGLPLSLDTTYLAADIGLPLLESDLVGRDIFALIEETSGQRLGRAEISVHSVNAGPDAAALLGIPSGAAVFAVERLTRMSDGRPVDTESIQIRADRIAFHAELHRGNRLAVREPAARRPG